jgi:uncharacterized protein (DUF983 family)
VGQSPRTAQDAPVRVRALVRSVTPAGHSFVFNSAIGTPRAYVKCEAPMETLNNDKPAPDSITKIVKVVIALIVVGVALWLVNTYIPMAASIRAILNVVVVVATCVLVLQAVGLWTAIVRLWTDLSHRISR